MIAPQQVGIGGVMEYNQKIFVFGSNREGRHSAGTALHAARNWGAKHGQARGLQGRSYAIVTKELRPDKPAVTLEEIAQEVEHFLIFAMNHMEMDFVVSAIGCGLAGFKSYQIAPMFHDRTTNVFLPEKFVEVLTGNRLMPAPRYIVCEGSAIESEV